MPDVQQKPLPHLPERGAWQGRGSVGALSYSRGIFRVEEEDAAGLTALETFYETIRVKLSQNLVKISENQRSFSLLFFFMALSTFFISSWLTLINI